MMPFTVLRRFSGSDYLLPGTEQDKPDKSSKEEERPFELIRIYPDKIQCNEDFAA